MKNAKTLLLVLSIAATALLASALMTACSGGGSGYSRTHMHYGAGYRGYYGRPWGYPPVYVGGGGPVDPDWGMGPDQPVAMPMPEMGMPDMDMGGFDW
ncbi:MAG: hypothetical protein HKP16_11035 [Xanthomonadales bacterium]|nr:hypothetical protein [Xanthomonadales bacterium]